jgi:hypothetical protein
MAVLSCSMVVLGLNDLAMVLFNFGSRALQDLHIDNAEIISLQQQIAGDIAEKLRSKLSASAKQQVAKMGTQNPEAYELY